MTKQTTKIISQLTCLMLIFLGWLVQGQAAGNNITLDWSTNTYTPSWYIGRALPVSGSQIEIVASLDGKSARNWALNYFWSVNNNPRSSGAGQNSLKFFVPEQNSKSIVVRLDIKEKYDFIASKEITINLAQPQLLIYNKENQNKAIANYRINSAQTLSLMAIPYFFNIKNPNDLSYEWSLNDQKTTGQNVLAPNSLLLEFSDPSGLSSLISQKLKVLVTNNKTYQSETVEIPILITP